MKVINIDENGAIGVGSELVLLDTDRMFKVGRICHANQLLFSCTIAGQGGVDAHTQCIVAFFIYKNLKTTYFNDLPESSRLFDESDAS